MSSSNAKDPLDALQLLVNDVLVQTGKALRTSRKDSQGFTTFAPEVAQSKFPETIKSFHRTLDELEFDIIRAKSVLMRDLDQLRERKKLLIKPEPSPVEPQSKYPITIDLDSPTSPLIKDEPMVVDDEARNPPMAPFPKMSIDVPKPTQADIAIKADPLSQPALDVASAPMKDPDTKPERIPDATGMNFTNMEFSLAPPPINESQAPPSTTGNTAFAMTTFAPADGGKGNAPASKKKDKVDGKGEAAGGKFNESYVNESGAADGMDFDFSLGTSQETFDDLMSGRDGTFENMPPGGDFDATFFGVEKAE